LAEAVRARHLYETGARRLLVASRDGVFEIAEDHVHLRDEFGDFGLSR
jgi:hypothetical protein